VSVERLAELLERRRPCVGLTGAGISTESGIPDFRSAAGIWARYDPAEVAHIDAFRRDPAVVWEFYALRLDALGAAEPNDGHRALAELEERGRVHAVITQNVDGLHQRAGSREVVEVHGSLREAECVHCGVRVPMEVAVASLPLPPCPECGEVLKPGVVMFGELLPALRSSGCRSSRRRRGYSSSSAPRSRCIRSLRWRARRWKQVARSRSSTVAAHPGTPARNSCSTALPAGR
jgi:NAD-dependent SIR2 family protein deacetylase